MLDHPSRHARHHGIRRHAPTDHRPGRDHGILTNRHALEDGRRSADPDIVADDDGRGRDSVSTLRRGHWVSRGDNGHLRTDHYIVTNDDAAHIHEVAALVDEDIGSDAYVKAAVGREWRDYHE